MLAGNRSSLVGEPLLSLRERRGTGGDGCPFLYVVRVQKFLSNFRSAMAFRDNINAGIHKRVIPASLAAVFCLAGFPSSASSKSRYTIQEMLDSSSEDPAHRYKFAGCLNIDAELLIRSGTQNKFKSLFLSDEDFASMVSGYMSKYQINSEKKFNDFMFNEESRLIIDHFKKLFKTQAGTDSVKKLCKKTMKAYVSKEAVNPLTARSSENNENTDNKENTRSALKPKTMKDA